jgi:hypothetical protein
MARKWTLSSNVAGRDWTFTMFTGKVMASIFWDAEGVLLVDYLQKIHTINGAYADLPK